MYLIWWLRRYGSYVASTEYHIQHNSNYLFPVNKKLALPNPIVNPIEMHIYSFGTFLADGVISNTTGNAIIGDNRGTRRLGMTKFSKDVSNTSIGLFAIVEQGSQVSLGSTG